MSRYPSFRVYHSSQFVGSFNTLAQGYRRAFDQLGVKAAFLNVTTPPDEDGFDASGSDYDVGLYLGHPTHLSLMAHHNRHKERLIMIAPNGNGVPKHVVEDCRKFGVKPISPSAWGAGVLANEFGLDEVDVARHGVYLPVGNASNEERLERARRIVAGQSPLRVLHVTSTASDRKGTLSMLREFEEINTKSIKLTIRCDMSVRQDITYAVERLAPRFKDAVRIDSNPVPNDGSWHDYLRSFDLVLQPSRAEGFGLVPLEAAAAGVPVVMTNVTGHREFSEDIIYCQVDVEDGIDDTRTIDGEEFGGCELVPGAIPGAVLMSADYLGDLCLDAEKARVAVAENWSWKNVVERWLKKRYG